MQCCFGPFGGAVLSLSIEKERHSSSVSASGSWEKAAALCQELYKYRVRHFYIYIYINKALTRPLQGGIYSPMGASVPKQDVDVSVQLQHSHQYLFIVCLQSNCLYITRCRAVQSNAKGINKIPQRTESFRFPYMQSKVRSMDSWNQMSIDCNFNTNMMVYCCRWCFWTH